MSVSIEQNLVDLVNDHCQFRRISRSLFVREAIRRALGQDGIILKEHTYPESARAMREDGKCNPNPRSGIVCWICWGEEE